MKLSLSCRKFVDFEMMKIDHEPLWKTVGWHISDLCRLLPLLRMYVDGLWLYV